jgi:hypothetical protein
VTLVLGPLRPAAWADHKWSISLESLANSDDVVTVRRLLHHCYNLSIGLVTGLWYVPVPWYWECQERLCGLGAQRTRGSLGAQQEPEGQMRRASSMLAFRQVGCRRHLRLGRAGISRGRAAGTYYSPARGTSGRLSAQLPLPIPFSASACEQAVSRELLLPLTRDTVLAAVPWLKSSPKARH